MAVAACAPTIALAIPLFLLRRVQKRMPEELSWFFQEFKFALWSWGPAVFISVLESLRLLQSFS